MSIDKGVGVTGFIRYRPAYTGLQLGYLRVGHPSHSLTCMTVASCVLFRLIEAFIFFAMMIQKPENRIT